MRLNRLFVTTVACAAILSAPSLRAETKELRLGYGLGVGFLPMFVMQEHKLIEKHAARANLGSLKVNWVKISGGTMMNDGLLSGSLQVASGGVTPLIVVWAKTLNTPLEVRGLGVLSSSPMYLVTRNPEVKTIKDLTAQDKIAMPAAKLAPQSVVLQMAAEKMLGRGRHGELDKFTVSMSHPDATAAILSGHSEVTSHFSTPPFMYQELGHPGVRTLLSSDDVLGGRGIFAVMWASKKFCADNPKTCDVVVKALDEAQQMIRADKEGAARTYVKISDPKAKIPDIVGILSKPELEFSRTPRKVMQYAQFMHRTGSIKVKPNSWKDMFFEHSHQLSGD